MVTNVEMDFHSMKRKQLQSLCKHHKIPANLSNLEMANRISQLLKGKEDENKKVKKSVRFSGEDEVFMYSCRCPKIYGRSMVVSKSSSSSLLSVVNVSCSQEKVSRGLKSMESKGRKNPAEKEDITTCAGIENLDNGKSNVLMVLGGRVTRSRSVHNLSQVISAKEEENRGRKRIGNKENKAAVDQENPGVLKSKLQGKSLEKKNKTVGGLKGIPTHNSISEYIIVC